MEKYEIQKLRELPIEKVAKEMGMKVEHHKALCPFHDDHHASLMFNKTKNSCRCYVCMRSSIGTIDLDEIPGEGFPLGLQMARWGTSDSAGGGFFIGFFIRRFFFW